MPQETPRLVYLCKSHFFFGISSAEELSFSSFGSNFGPPDAADFPPLLSRDRLHNPLSSQRVPFSSQLPPCPRATDNTHPPHIFNLTALSEIYSQM